MARRIHVLPNLLTLGNAFCGLLALAKAIDALALSRDDPIDSLRRLCAADRHDCE